MERRGRITPEIMPYFGPEDAQKLASLASPAERGIRALIYCKFPLTIRALDTIKGGSFG
jgi:hypothetical protein